MHAAGMRLHERDQLRVGLVLDVVEAEAAVRVGSLVALARLDLGVDHHDVADDAHLVGVRHRMRRHELADDLGMSRVGDVEDRGPSGPCWCPTKAKSPWITICPPPGSSMRLR